MPLFNELFIARYLVIAIEPGCIRIDWMLCPAKRPRAVRLQCFPDILRALLMYFRSSNKVLHHLLLLLMQIYGDRGDSCESGPAHQAQVAESREESAEW